MAEFLFFLLFVFGLLIIVKGSDWFVESAVWFAQVFRIPSIIIGATIVSICTTLPETFVSISAAYHGDTNMALGNALGSIGVNTGFILAILLVFTRPIIENLKEFLENSLFLVTMTAFLWIVGYYYGEIAGAFGVALIFFLILYLLNNIRNARKLMDLDIIYDIEDEEHVADHLDLDSNMPEGVSYDESENDFDISFQVIVRKIFFFVFGVVLVLIGSNLLVVNGIKIAEFLKVPTILIAVVFTAVGTSLPELVTTITSIKKGVSNLGIGNIIGANILNIVQVIGISSLFSEIPLLHEKSILSFQLPLILLMGILVIFFAITGKGKFYRWHGYILLALYLLFLSSNLLRDQMPIFGPLF